MTGENEYEKLVVKIEADNVQYNTSIDDAIARTKAMQVQQKKLVDDLNRNEQAQKSTAVSVENNTKSLIKNATAIQSAIAKYGAESAEVTKLNERKDKLTQTSERLAKRVEKLSNSEQAMNRQLISLNKSLDGTQREFSETSIAADKTGRSIGSLKSSMSGFTSVIAAAATGYTGKKFLEATIGGLAQFEQYETSFAVMLGDMGKAKSMLSDLKDFATKTPFEMTDVTKAGTLLMNYGVEAEKLIPIMTQLGDLSQGQAVKLDRVSLAYGQMLQKGKVTGEELRQMVENGVPLTQALAESIGVSTAEIAKLIEAGTIGIPELNKAIESLTTGNGKFAGMMEKQSKTLIGLWSTAKDEMSSIAREMGEDAFVEVKDGLKDVMAEISTMRNNGEMKALAKDLGGLLSGMAKGFVGVTKGAIENKEAVGGLVAAYGAFKIVQQSAIVVKAYQEALTTATVATKSAAVAQGTLNAVIGLNPYVLLAGALTATVGALVMFSNSTNEAEQRVKELKEEMSNFNADNIEGASSQLADLRIISEQTIPNIRELGEKTNKTAGEKELLKQYIEDLNTALGYEAVSIDNVSESLAKNSIEIKKKIKSLEDLARAEAINDKMAEKYSERIEAEMALADAELKRAEAQRKLSEMPKSEIEEWGGVDIDKIEEMDNLSQIIKDQSAEMKTQQSIIDNLDEYIKKLSNAQNKLSVDTDVSTGSIGKFWQEMSNGNTTSVVSDLKSMSETLQILTSAQKEYEDSNSLSVSTLEALAKQYPVLSGKLGEYSAGLIGIQDVVSEFPDLYEGEKNAYVESLKQKLTGSETFYKQNILSQNALVTEYSKDYKIDLSNFETLAQAKVNIEATLVQTLKGYWADYYNSVGGNATKTVTAMQEQLKHLVAAKASMSISMDVNAIKGIDEQIANIESMINSLSPLRGLESIEMSVDFTQIEDNFDSLLDKIGTTKERVGKSAKETAKKTNDILKETYDQQLKIAQDYLNQRKKQINEEYNAKVKKINEGMDLEKKSLESWYNREKEQVKSSIDAVNELINAKRKAHEDEKLDDNLTFAQKRVEMLQKQITYSRSPEEKAELEKELARQQEDLKDLTVQKEVSELESQKKTHEDNLSRIEERYKAENEYIENRRKAELSAIDEAKNATLSSLEVTFTQFGDNLAATYGYVNNETLAIGQRFAGATVGALESGFNTVVVKSQQVIDNMLVKVQNAISSMYAMVDRVSEQYAQRNNGDRYSYDTYDSSDSRSFTVTNHITRGLTEGQVERLMQRQAEDFLYKRR